MKLFILIFSTKYRREVLIEKPFKGFCKIVQSKRNGDAQMQIDFPSSDQIGQLKKAVDTAEMTLRGGSMTSDYNGIVQGTKGAAEGGLKAWKSVETIVKAGNGFAEIGLGGHSLVESIHEWRKGHYLCCVCSGIACSCFWIAAISGYIPRDLVFGKVQLKRLVLRKG